MLPDLIFLLLTLITSVAGAFAFHQVRRHGWSRWWSAIPFVALFAFMMFLMLLPGPFLFGIVE